VACAGNTSTSTRQSSTSGARRRDTQSRRSLALPKRAIAALCDRQKALAAERVTAGEDWEDNGLVFSHPDGRQYTRDDLNWRFSKMTSRAGLGHWHAREAQHTAVSIMSHNGATIQDTSDTMGHKSTHVTETIYRDVIAPAIMGA
jgi:integrase